MKRLILSFIFGFRGGAICHSLDLSLLVTFFEQIFIEWQVEQKKRIHHYLKGSVFAKNDTAIQWPITWTHKPCERHIHVALLKWILKVYVTLHAENKFGLRSKIFQGSRYILGWMLKSGLVWVWILQQFQHFALFQACLQVEYAFMTFSIPNLGWRNDSIRPW